ncbi:DUF2716 domain-containing protein [Bacillus velezensis]
MNWHCLSEEETERLWRRVNRAVKWKPGSIFASIKPPKPFQIFDVSQGFNNEKGRIGFQEDAEVQLLKAFQSCTLKHEFMYALDWQHECYLFNPHVPIDKDESVNGLSPLFQTETMVSLFTRSFSGGCWGIRGSKPLRYLAHR